MRGSENKSPEPTQNSILRLISDKKTLQLIQEYKNEECLWNSHLKDYPNKQKRMKAANKIARILDIPNFEGKHVLIKFKNLRNSYSQELKKIASNLSAIEAGTETELYQPKVQWFPLMDSFIRPHIQTSVPIFSSFQSDNNNPDAELECGDDIQEDWTVMSQDTPETREYGELSNDSRKRRRLSTPTIESTSENVQLIIPDCSKDSKFVDGMENIHNNFGKYIASLLRTLPPEKALKLQSRIVSMIVDEGCNGEFTSDANMKIKVENLASQH